MPCICDKGGMTKSDRYFLLSEQKLVRTVGSTTRTWNSVMSTLRAPSKRSDAVSDEITWAIKRFKFVYVGRYTQCGAIL